MTSDKQVSESRIRGSRGDVGHHGSGLAHEWQHQRPNGASSLDTPRRPRFGPADPPHHGVSRHVQHELLELGIEFERIWPSAVVAGEVPGLQARLTPVLRNQARAAHLYADEHDLFARATDARPCPLHDLTVGPHVGKVQVAAMCGRELAEKRIVGVGLAIEFDKGVADRILPKLKAFALGDFRRRQHGFHYTAPAMREDRP